MPLPAAPPAALAALQAPGWLGADALLTALAVVGLAVPLLLALLAWKAARLVARVVLLALAVGVALVVWRERSDLVDCVELVQATAEAAGAVEGRCQVFGVEVPIPGTAS